MSTYFFLIFDRFQLLSSPPLIHLVLAGWLWSPKSTKSIPVCNATHLIHICFHLSCWQRAYGFSRLIRQSAGQACSDTTHHHWGGGVGYGLHGHHRVKLTFIWQWQGQWRLTAVVNSEPHSAHSAGRQWEQPWNQPRHGLIGSKGSDIPRVVGWQRKSQITREREREERRRERESFLTIL